jgi:hypothetical protein
MFTQGAGSNETHDATSEVYPKTHLQAAVIRYIAVWRSSHTAHVSRTNQTDGMLHRVPRCM